MKMTTLTFKIWLLCLWLCTAPLNHVVVIKSDPVNCRSAVMNKEKQISYIDSYWLDGDMLALNEDGIEYLGYIWRYNNAGTFYSIAYPWHWTGRKPPIAYTRMVQ